MTMTEINRASAGPAAGTRSALPLRRPPGTGRRSGTARWGPSTAGPAPLRSAAFGRLLEPQAASKTRLPTSASGGCASESALPTRIAPSGGAGASASEGASPSGSRLPASHPLDRRPPPRRSEKSARFPAPGLAPILAGREEGQARLRVVRRRAVQAWEHPRAAPSRRLARGVPPRRSSRSDAQAGSRPPPPATAWLTRLIRIKAEGRELGSNGGGSNAGTSARPCDASLSSWSP